MPVLLAPSPHEAERIRAARRVWRLGLVLVIYAALVIAFQMDSLIWHLRMPSTALASWGVTKDQMILRILWDMIPHLLIGAAGAGLIVASRAVRCGMRWAYMMVCALSAGVAAYSALVALPIFHMLTEMVSVQFADLSWGELLRAMGWIRFLLVFVPPILYAGAVFLAALALHAVLRLYWIEYRATPSAIPRTRV